MIYHIVAFDQQQGIAKQQAIPWNLPEDRRYFRAQTYGHTILMGRHTYDTFTRPLPGRQNDVLTRLDHVREGFRAIHDLASYLKNAPDPLWIIGGAQLYSETLTVADFLYITRIDQAFGCDLFFPQFDDAFVQISQSADMKQDDTSFHFEVWKRRT